MSEIRDFDGRYASQRRAKYIHMRVTPEEHSTALYMARKSRKSLTRYITDLIADAARADPAVIRACSALGIEVGAVGRRDRITRSRTITMTPPIAIHQDADGYAYEADMLDVDVLGGEDVIGVDADAPRAVRRAPDADTGYAIFA